jgi:gamma-glutamyltranspeptidase/glutathione hydrolase
VKSAGAAQVERHLALATPHELSTQAGGEAFAAGGNALDAALAAAASLTVTLPDNCGLGGDLFALVHSPEGDVRVINASGPAASAIDIDRVRRSHGTAMPFFSAEAVTVPGMLRGWEALAETGAERPWASAFGAAAAQARDGVPLAGSAAAALAKDRQRLGSDPGMAEVFFVDGEPRTEGERVVQPRVAETLEQLAEHGVRAFYEGAIGQEWLRCMRVRGSDLDQGDLARFEVETTHPIGGAYGDLEILTAPPNSQGALLLQTLAGAERDGVHDPLSAEAPILARAFAMAADTRERLLADPRQAEVSLAQLLAGSPTPATAPSDRSPSGDTVALVAADSDGWAVSLIQSLFDSFGCGILHPETGIIAHNRGSFFSLDSDSPNVLAPGKRPAHTLTPVMVRKGGELRYVLGTMGGLAQTQILTHVILQLGMGRSVEAAVGARRWILGSLEAHGEHAAVQAEEGVDEAATSALREHGWSVNGLEALSLSVGESVGLERLAGGDLEAAADPRGLGAAVVLHRDQD